MKRLMLGIALALHVVWPVALNAADSGITIHWQKKTVASKEATQTGPKAPAKSSEDCIYLITLENNSFKDTPEMVVKYRVFVERQKTGEKVGNEHIQAVKGAKPVSAIRKGQKATVETNPFVLRQAQLGGGMYFATGGRVAAKDSIKGVWVRVYQDENLVAEYMNPSTLSTKESWNN